MARSRNIKPGFFVNEDLADLDPLIRILFIGLWTIADKEGRLEDRPRRIQASCLPYEQVNVDSCLAQLQTKHFIDRYSIGSEKYIQINNWRKHQNPHHKESDSSIPEKPEYYEEKQKFIHAQAKHESSMSQERLNEIASCPTDSLNLIPDSLNLELIPDSEVQTPSSSVVEDKKQDVEKPSPRKQHKQDAIKILDFMNNKCSRDYRPTDSNLNFIIDRLKEGFEPTDLTRVIIDKFNQWHADDNMRHYLRPATLFNKTKFSQYVGELPKELGGVG